MTISAQAILCSLKKALPPEAVALIATLHGITLPNQAMTGLELAEINEMADCFTVGKSGCLYRMNRGYHLGQYPHAEAGQTWRIFGHLYVDVWFEPDARVVVGIEHHNWNFHPARTPGEIIDTFAGLESIFIEQKGGFRHGHGSFILFRPEPEEHDRVVFVLTTLVRYLAAHEAIPDQRRDALLMLLTAPQQAAAA